MATLKAGTTIAGQTAWHAGNDGPGTGLDADLLDGQHASAFKTTVAITAPTPTRVGELWVDSDDTLLTVDDNWTYPTLINGWANYDATWEQTRFVRIIGNQCVIEGMVKGTNNTVCFVLPIGYRPLYVQHKTTMCDPNFDGTVHVYPDGSVVPYTPNGTTANWISIHTSFYIEA